MGLRTALLHPLLAAGGLLISSGCVAIWDRQTDGAGAALIGGGLIVIGVWVRIITEHDET
jgi:hypothetical protein